MYKTCFWPSLTLGLTDKKAICTDYCSDVHAPLHQASFYPSSVLKWYKISELKRLHGLMMLTFTFVQIVYFLFYGCVRMSHPIRLRLWAHSLCLWEVSLNDVCFWLSSETYSVCWILPINCDNKGVRTFLPRADSNAVWNWGTKKSHED